MGDVGGKGRQTIEPLNKLSQKYYENNIYNVWINNPAELFIHITVARKDNKPVNNWYDLWNIKNQLAGEDATAIEIYPARNDLIDGQNQRHLFVLPKYICPEKIDFGNVHELFLYND